MPKVELDAKNLNRCLCPSCPVQAESECVRERMQGSVQPRPSEGEMPDPEMMIRLYCSIGESSCQDLDGAQPCLCPTCPVWDDYDLNAQYYCLRGNADEIDME